MYEAGEMDGTSIIARGKSSEMFQASEASFDLVAMLVGGSVVRDEDLAVALGGDYRLGVHGGDALA
jgi:hypothetical protein